MWELTMYLFFSPFPPSQGPKTSISHYHETLGEALQGTELEFSGLNMEYKGEEWQQLYYSEMAGEAGRKRFAR